MVEEFLKNHWLILINIPVFAVSIGSFLILFGTYNRYTRINKNIRVKFLSDLEKERRKISRELHDSVSPFTILLKDYFSNLSEIEGTKTKEEWQREISNFEQYIAKVNETLYPSEFLEGDLYSALYAHVNSFNDSHLNISLWIEEKPKIHRRYGIQIYRIIQESIVNVAKHTDSKHLTIYIDQEKNKLKIVLSYSNSQSVSSKYFSGKRGKKIIDERMQIVNGVKEVVSSEDTISEVFSFNIVKDEYSYN